MRNIGIYKRWTMGIYSGIWMIYSTPLPWNLISRHTQIEDAPSFGRPCEAQIRCLTRIWENTSKYSEAVFRSFSKPLINRISQAILRDPNFKFKVTSYPSWCLMSQFMRFKRPYAFSEMFVNSWSMLVSPILVYSFILLATLWYHHISW